MSTAPLIELAQLQKIFVTDQIQTHALTEVNLTVRKGEFVAITGPSGCGKSTLLSLLGLLDVSSGGEYRLAGNVVSGLSRDQRAAIRNREIGFVFQAFNLISDLTAEENVALPLTYRSDLTRQQRNELVNFALEKVDIVHRRKHFPSQLSGGQQQRIAVARAIAGRPALILADEPTGNLDSKNAESVMELIDTLHREGSTICMVTHDPRSAARAQRRVEMFDGRIVSDQVTRAAEPIAA
ncbi:MAG TPA: ABC transporter ATP-binding protein [Tahibacter sp.]|nr:ABC transporter ATP-binding protein [Tahibacter sp.]